MEVFALYTTITCTFNVQLNSVFTFIPHQHADAQTRNGIRDFVWQHNAMVTAPSPRASYSFLIVIYAYNSDVA